MPVPDSNTTPRGMLIPEVDDVDPVLTPAEQTQLDDRRRLLDTASIVPAVYPANDGRVNTVSNTRIDISHALDNDGTTVEAGKRRLFDYTLIRNTQTHWEAGKELTFCLEYRSLENDGQYDQPKAMDDTVWDRTCRLVVTLETDGGHQPPASVPNTVVPLFTADFTL